MESDDKGLALQQAARATAAEPVVSALRDGIANALDVAIKLAVDAHAGQVDKAGEPYILHPLRVMLACKGETERIVAVLHDVVEDSPITLSRIDAEFGAFIANAVDALTRRPGEDYGTFIERCAQCGTARRVKLADLADNMNLERLGREPTISDARRQWKYGDARNVLMTAEYAQGMETRQGGDGTAPSPDDSPVGATDAPICPTCKLTKDDPDNWYCSDGFHAPNPQDGGHNEGTH